MSFQRSQVYKLFGWSLACASNLTTILYQFWKVRASRLKMTLRLKVALLYYTASICVLVLFAVLRAMKHLPILHHLVPKLMKNISTIEMKKETYWDSIFTWNMYRAITDGILNELQKKVCISSRAQNSTLSTVDGQRRKNLFEVFPDGRPLVLNFGSYSCPIFMARMKEFTTIVKEFNDVADFLIIYIEEAHPSDGWAFKNNVNIRRHKTLGERCTAAKLLLQTVELPCSLLVDTLENETSLSYAAFPIRLYVIENGRVMYAGGPGPTNYNLSEVRSCLGNWKAALQESKKVKTKRACFSRAG